MEIMKMMDQYYENNAEKLHKVVDSIIKNFGGISNKDLDDFYSLANEVFWFAVNDFDGTGRFDGFLYSRLDLKIKTMITGRNRMKRCDTELIKTSDGSVKKKYHTLMSLDAEVGNEPGGATLGEITPSDFDLEETVMEKYSQANVYIENLPKVQRQIVLLLLDGYKPAEIRGRLHISEKEYTDHMIGIRSYENTSILFA